MFPLAPYSPEEDFFLHRLIRVVPEKGHKAVVRVCVRSLPLRTALSEVVYTIMCD